MSRLVRILFFALILIAPQLRAQTSPEGVELTERSLLASTSAVEAGKPFHLGIRLKIADGWHSYWIFPGSAGFPLSAKWELPAGFTAGPLEFPLPEKVVDQYGQTLFAYEHEIVFPVKITPPATLPAGELKFTAALRWQVCKDTCIAGNGSVAISLPAGTAKPANDDVFTRWLAQVPKTDPAPVKAVEFGAKELTVRIEGFAKNAKIEFFPLPPAGSGVTFEIGKKLEHESDDDAHTFRFPFDGAAPVGKGWGGLLVVEKDGKREGWMVGTTSAEPAPEKAATPAAPATVASEDAWDPFDDIAAAEKGRAASDGSGGIWALLLQGFLGGLLLNLMPCVLPVISLKIFGFVRQAGESKDRVFKLGLAFCAGVFGFFLLLALLVLGLASANQSLGWGAQFSNPIALTVMVAVMFVFGLSLLGVFEITLGGAESKLSEASSKEGFGGAFVHGFFTTLLGTSCTAPLVGPVIGTAVNQPGIIIFALFGAIATGLSLPYFLLTWQPAWMKFLPKPGTWMVRFKQVLGFVMLAFAVWLLGSLPSSPMIIYAAAFLLVLGFAAWLLGTYHGKRWVLPIAVLIGLGGWWFFVRGKIERPPVQVSTLVADVKKGLKEGRPVFVDFTADWCLNCKTYEKLVLDTEPVKAAMKAKNVHFVVADYTTEPPEIAAALKKLGRAGVPVYVLFRKRGDYWIADGLTQSGLLAELDKLPAK